MLQLKYYICLLFLLILSSLDTKFLDKAIKSGFTTHLVGALATASFCLEPTMLSNFAKSQFFRTNFVPTIHSKIKS